MRYTGTARPAYISDIRTVTEAVTHLTFTSYEEDNNKLLWRLANQLGCYISNSYYDQLLGIKGTFEATGYIIDTGKAQCQICKGECQTEQLSEYEQFCQHCIREGEE